MEYFGKLESFKKFILANQLFTCGTSIGGNWMETQNAESKADFIHKIRIAATEAQETQNWLRLCEYASDYPDYTPGIGRWQEINNVLW